MALGPHGLYHPIFFGKSFCQCALHKTLTSRFTPSSKPGTPPLEMPRIHHFLLKAAARSIPLRWPRCSLQFLLPSCQQTAEATSTQLSVTLVGSSSHSFGAWGALKGHLDRDLWEAICFSEKYVQNNLLWIISRARRFQKFRKHSQARINKPLSQSCSGTMAMFKSGVAGCLVFNVFHRVFQSFSQVPTPYYFSMLFAAFEMAFSFSPWLPIVTQHFHRFLDGADYCMAFIVFRALPR